VALNHDRSAWELQFALQTTRADLRRLAGTIRDEDAPDQAGAEVPIPAVARAPDWSRVMLTHPMDHPGEQCLDLGFVDHQRRVLFSGRLKVHASYLDDPRPGYWLGQGPGLGAWWCESGWKIGRDRGLPRPPRNGRPVPVRIALARGEYEPVQLVLRPDQAGQLLSAHLRWKGRAATGSVTPSVQVQEVAYVPVVRPTDRTGVPGWHPDPLPPLRLPLRLYPNQNQPLWITFHASRECIAGAYPGELELRTTLGEQRFPVELQVYDFAMPPETHLRSALGLSPSAVNEYHHLARREEQEAVFEKYLRNFSEHRISPYSFYPYAPIEVRFVGEGPERRAQLDFTRFDRAAARWLDEGRFSTFQLRLLGMGGGTFQSRHLGSLEGFQEGTPEHARLFQDYLGQVETHLRQRGWIEKAFTYWFDEPDPKDYEFVIAGMKRLKAAAPGLKRLLTEQPEPVLLGHVDIWCGLTPEWTRERVRERRLAGEEVWWYICCAPVAPYLTEFIDHPGTELRLWPWQSWQYGVTGILIWETTYWNSPLVFRAPQRQDPWTNPMSYVSGYDFPVGHVGYWGNGDGRFLYPPRPPAAAPGTPCLEEPINSLRWENLRDGMEDYEYLWLLQQEIQRLEPKARARAAVDKAKALLVVPAAVSQDLTHFTTDPRILLRHRDQVARMIVALQRF
jgi:hypothetical protein